MQIKKKYFFPKYTSIALNSNIYLLKLFPLLGNGKPSTNQGVHSYFKLTFWGIPRWPSG